MAIEEDKQDLLMKQLRQSNNKVRSFDELAQLLHMVIKSLVKCFVFVTLLDFISPVQKFHCSSSAQSCRFYYQLAIALHKGNIINTAVVR